MRKISIILTVLALILLVSCSVRDNTYLTKPIQTTPHVENNPDSENPINVEITPEIGNPEENSAEVKALLSKSKEITNYYYLYDNPSIESYEVFVKDGKIKKVYVTPINIAGGIYYNEVYLDSTPRTAIAICTKTSVLCDEAREKAYSLNYENQLPEIDPVALINKVKTAVKAGTQVVQNRQTTILEYINANGKREQLFVDYYYGIPLKQIIYGVKEDQILEENLFTRVSAGNVKESEVTMPSSYELQP